MLGARHESDREAMVAAVRRYRALDQLIPSHWIEGAVSANGIRQAYLRTGGEKPPLLLLHGFQEAGACWLRVANALDATSTW